LYLLMRTASSIPDLISAVASFVLIVLSCSWAVPSGVGQDVCYHWRSSNWGIIPHECLETKGGRKNQVGRAALLDRLPHVYFSGPIDEVRTTPITKPIKAAIATTTSPYGFLSISLILSRLLLEILLDGAGGD